MDSTTLVSFAVRDGLLQQLYALQRKYPDLDGDAIVNAALERFIECEIGPTVTIPHRLFQDLILICCYSEFLTRLDAQGLADLSDRSRDVSAWAEEYQVRRLIDCGAESGT